MYFCKVVLKTPPRCYFCDTLFNQLNSMAVVEGVIFCPNCGYEIHGSVLEVQEESFEDMDYDNRR